MVIFRYIRIVSPSHWLLGIHTRNLLRLVKSVTGNLTYERIFIEIEIEKRSSVRYRAERQPSRQVLLANLINRASRHGPKSVGWYELK